MYWCRKPLSSTAAVKTRSSSLDLQLAGTLLDVAEGRPSGLDLAPWSLNIIDGPDHWSRRLDPVELDY